MNLQKLGRLTFGLGLIFSILVYVIGCGSGSIKDPPKILAATCQPTPVTVGDLQKFGFVPTPGKIVVVRLMRISCPFCKEDLHRIGALFQNGTWSKDKVQVFLIAYRKEGVEDRKTFDRFMREELLQTGIPMEAVQAVYLDKDYYSLVKSKNANGDLVFETWKAVPFGLVFGRDGRLAYRGHFTTSPGSEEVHYNFVTHLQNEPCKPPLAKSPN